MQLEVFQSRSAFNKMKLFIKAKPSAGENKIKKLSDTNFIVSVKEPPVKGKANRAIINLIAEYFKVSPLKIKIIAGFSSRQKILEISE